jgi:hypothetical protein
LVACCEEKVSEEKVSGTFSPEGKDVRDAFVMEEERMSETLFVMRLDALVEAAAHGRPEELLQHSALEAFDEAVGARRVRLLGAVRRARRPLAAERA